MTTTMKASNPERAALAYRHAIAIKDQAEVIAPDFPAMSKTLLGVARSLIAEGAKAEKGK